MANSRIQKSPPRHPALHKHVMPERRWRRPQFERRQPPRKNHIPQIPEEHSRPRRQLDQQPRSGRWLRDSTGCTAGRHHSLSIVDARIALRIASRTSRRQIQVQSGRRDSRRQPQSLSFRAPFFWREEPAFPIVRQQCRHQTNSLPPALLSPQPFIILNSAFCRHPHLKDKDTLCSIS